MHIRIYLVAKVRRSLGSSNLMLVVWPRIMRSLQPMRFTGSDFTNQWEQWGGPVSRVTVCVGLFYGVLGYTWWFKWILVGSRVPWVPVKPVRCRFSQVLHLKFTVFWSKCQLLLSIETKVLLDCPRNSVCLPFHYALFAVLVTIKFFKPFYL